MRLGTEVRTEAAGDVRARAGAAAAAGSRRRSAGSPQGKPVRGAGRKSKTTEKEL